MLDEALSLVLDEVLSLVLDAALFLLLDEVSSSLELSVVSVVVGLVVVVTSKFKLF